MLLDGNGQYHVYHRGLDKAIIVGITELSKRHYSNSSTTTKYYVKQYENSYHQVTTCNGLPIFAFFFVLHSRTIVSFLLLNLVDLKFHRKDNLKFSWVHGHLFSYPKIKSYPLQDLGYL